MVFLKRNTTIFFGLFLLVSLLWPNEIYADTKDTLEISPSNNLKNISNAEIVYSDQITYFENGTIPTNEALFRQHCFSLEFVIPMDYNPYVKRQIDYFGVSWQSKLKTVLNEATFYFPIYERIIDKYDMPLELVYLSVIESALNPNAVSRSGAVGPWQFMPATGKSFDLKIDRMRDERRSVEKSTEAACLYLKEMYRVHGDWLVALASYNCGPGNIRKAVRASGRTDFWGMYDYLPKQTQDYVPKFIAMAYLMNFYSEFNIYPAIPSQDKEPYHPIYCTGNVCFKAIAEQLSVEEGTLLAYNPELKSPNIPHQGYWLNVPREKVLEYYVNEGNIIALSEQLGTSQAEESITTVEDTRLFISYKIKKGDSLPRIARLNNCSVDDLKQWNSLSSSTIHPNQRIKILK